MTDNWKLLDRQGRGVMLAAMVKMRQAGRIWIVPSQSESGKKYKVDPHEQSPHCTCPDFEMHGHTCKHIYAVRLVRQRELFDDGTEVITESVTVTKKVSRAYPQNWPAYNRAQTTEKETFQVLLHALCQGVEEPERHGAGRPGLPLADAVFAVCFKVYSTFSARRFMSDLRDARAKGHIGSVPHFNSICNHMERESMTPILHDLIVRSSLPLCAIEQDFAADSTGFSTSRFYRWFDHKYGTEKLEQDWVKVHLMVGVNTHIVTAVEIQGRCTNDSPLLPVLLNGTAKNFKIGEVSADKQYASENNFQAIASHGATAFIPFKTYTTGGIGGLFAKAFHYFNLYREEFLTHYHKRSNIETAVMMIKSKFGDAVRSKTDVAMKNEALAKVLCHNLVVLVGLMHEFGIQPDFANTPACTKIIAAAQ
jgi:transposase